MKDPVTLLIELNYATLKLNDTQAAIDRMRAEYPTDHLVQLELDRSQAEVDERRRAIEVIKFDISRRN